MVLAGVQFQAVLKMITNSLVIKFRIIPQHQLNVEFSSIVLFGVTWVALQTIGRDDDTKYQ
jgi:hypothetical protein